MSLGGPCLAVTCGLRHFFSIIIGFSLDRAPAAATAAAVVLAAVAAATANCIMRRRRDIGC